MSKCWSSRFWCWQEAWPQLGLYQWKHFLSYQTQYLGHQMLLAIVQGGSISWKNLVVQVWMLWWMEHLCKKVLTISWQPFSSQQIMAKFRENCWLLLLILSLLLTIICYLVVTVSSLCAVALLLLMGCCCSFSGLVWVAASFVASLLEYFLLSYCSCCQLSPMLLSLQCWMPMMLLSLPVDCQFLNCYPVVLNYDNDYCTYC